MTEIKIGVVVTATKGREENLAAMLTSVLDLYELPWAIAIVLDGFDTPVPEPPPSAVPIYVTKIAKHEPGQEQPRNVGVRLLREETDCTHAWFIDSDIIVEPEALSEYEDALDRFGPCVVAYGPYEWMSPGVREAHAETHTDFRWAMFNERGPGPFVADLGVALGCFGGNLVWPIEQFMEVGGFHPMLHHGRCEDGELGLRAASHEIPMVLVKTARGYHLYHEIDTALAEQRNRRDVPLLNSWHPWIEGQGLLVTERDGARFEFRCSCGEQVNTLLMWDHMAKHNDPELAHREPTSWETPPPPVAADELILPEGWA